MLPPAAVRFVERLLRPPFAVPPRLDSELLGAAEVAREVALGFPASYPQAAPGAFQAQYRWRVRENWGIQMSLPPALPLRSSVPRLALLVVAMLAVPRVGPALVVVQRQAHLQRHQQMQILLTAQ